VAIQTLENDMNIEGSIALVTGANRGLGKAYAEALLAAGAAKVYAGARDPSTITDQRLTPIRLDVTSPGDIAAAAGACRDVNLLINNAGAMLMTSMLARDSDTALRREMEVNVFGVLAMVRAFAPILARNGGGAIANMLSVVSWYVFPFNATYCASKHAALAVTDAARIELKAQGTHVVGVYAGFIDTDMAAVIDQPKTSPQQVAERTLDGIRTGRDHVLADARAEQLWQALRTDPAQVAHQMQQRWDQGAP
jgi:NAD(P)-dependent dehydrogenase (short-subunit alcohol dehydrogenase family)